MLEGGFCDGVYGLGNAAYRADCDYKLQKARDSYAEEVHRVLTPFENLKPWELTEERIEAWRGYSHFISRIKAADYNLRLNSNDGPIGFVSGECSQFEMQHE